MSAKIKLLGFSGVLFAVIIFTISLVSYLNFKNSSVDAVTQKLDNGANLIANALEQKMMRYFDSLTLIATVIPVDGDRTDFVMVQRQLHHLHKELDVLEAYIGLENGDTYLPEGKIPNFNAKQLKREWYTRVFDGEGKIITTPYQSSAGFPVMAVAVPVKREGKIVAVLCINIGVQSITDFVAQLPDGDQTYVSREDGFVLASKFPEQIGKDIFNIYPLFKTFLSTSESGSTFESKGEQYLVLNTTLKNLGWNVWAWDSWNHIDESSTDNLLLSIAIALFSLGVALVISYYLITNLMYRPIGGEPKEIELLVQQVANGDLSRAGSSKGDETGVYAATLLMVLQLKSTLAEINSASAKLNKSADAMSITANNVNNSSKSQMLQLEQTSTAMNEMTVTVDEVARNALQASTAAHDAQQSSDKGIEIVTDMNKEILTLVKGLEKVVGVTNLLEKETQNIGGILEVIDSISEQTNLLALNAAIEAARAGDHGRGFAVVADEVRNLANRTKESTREIQDMIAKLQTEAKNSVSLMQVNMDNAQETTLRSTSATEALNAIQQSVIQILDMNNQIATAAEQQTHVASEINQSIVAINDSARDTFESTEINNKLAIELKNVSKELIKSVEVFRL